MKIRKKKSSNSLTVKLPPWKVLLVDDEADIHAMTRLTLSKFQFANRKLQIFQAMSSLEAREILAAEPEIAVALVDVVMETDDAGLQLVDFIRNELKYRRIRLIIRTGQPGTAPEKEVIERYDINDYKDKTELTDKKLFTTMRLALKSYRDISTLDTNRQALANILEAAPGLYHPQPISQFFSGVLTQIIGLCNLGETSLISTISDGLVVTTSGNQVNVQAGTGRLANPSQNPEVENIIKACSTKSDNLLPFGAILIPLKVNNTPIGCIYLENAQHLSEADKNLINLMVDQCTSAMENLQFCFKKDNKLALAEQARQMTEKAVNCVNTIIQKEASGEELLPALEQIQKAAKQLVTITSDILDN